MRDDRIYLRGQRYRFELDVLAFCFAWTNRNYGSEVKTNQGETQTTRSRAAKFDELIFVGDSNKCESSFALCPARAENRGTWRATT